MSAASTTNTTTTSKAIVGVENEMKHKRGVVACMKYVGAPLSRDQAKGKLDHCPRFKQLVLESQGMNMASSNTAAAATAAASSWSSVFLHHHHNKQTTACEGQDDFDIVDRAVILDYGTRLRTCLLEAKKVKHSTPY